MDIRRVLRLCCLTVAGFFWASCSSDSSTQVSDPEILNPDSSTGGTGPTSGSDSSVPSSSSAESSESGSAAEESSSSNADEPSSSSGVNSSSDEQSSSSGSGYVLAKDRSVACEPYTFMQKNSCDDEVSFSCEAYKEYLASDTTLSEKLLLAWEKGLLDCGAIQDAVTLYGVGAVYNSCLGYSYAQGMKCSDGNSYPHYYVEGKLVYADEEEYNEAHGVSSSSVAESSSSQPEDLVENCPHGDYALFADVLADVQKELYGKIVKKLEENTSLPETGKKYLEDLLDRENESLKGNFSPYYLEYNYGVESTVLGISKFWFNGYIAKTETCAGSASVTTSLYKQYYDSILEECENLIEYGLAEASK